uniref:Uncharacterized protein n=1 Tax=Equus asinus asinus TaxID=83772 RepID=A0A8C4LCU8_EQUAS
MKLPLLLALLFGAVSALPLSKSPWFSSPLGDDTLPQDGDMPERGAMEAPMEGMMLLEGEEEGGFRSEVVPEEEGLIKSVSALEEVDKDFQCPKEKDTVKLEGIPGWKTCCFIVVMTARTYNQAPMSGLWLRLSPGVGRRAWRGMSLTSVSLVIFLTEDPGGRWVRGIRAVDHVETEVITVRGWWAGAGRTPLTLGSSWGIGLQPSWGEGVLIRDEEGRHSESSLH